MNFKASEGYLFYATLKQRIRRSAGKWMALIAALLGWLFDGFEIGMFPLVWPHALKELLQDELSANPTAKISGSASSWR